MNTRNATDNPRVIVQNVTKCFNKPSQKYDKLSELLANPKNFFKRQKFCPIQNINFKVKNGETFAIIGPNGAGKSTLLKVLANILVPDTGQVIRRGKMVPFLELGVGFHPDLTVKENVFLNGLILGMTRDYLEEKFDYIIEFAELEEFVDVPLKNLSSGMKVRLAFSIAFLSEADIYLLDEVLAVGDIRFQEKSYKVLRGLKERGKTVIVVTHNLNYVAENADRVLLLWDHKVRSIGDPKSIIKEYRSLMFRKAKGQPIN